MTAAGHCAPTRRATTPGATYTDRTHCRFTETSTTGTGAGESEHHARPHRQGFAHTHWRHIVEPRIDIPLEIFRTQLQTALHTLTTLQESQERMLKLTLKSVEDAEQRSLEACASASEAKTWPEMAALPTSLLQCRIEQNTKMFQTMLGLMNEQHAALLQEAHTCADAWRTLASNWGSDPLMAPVRSLFDPLSETRPEPPARTPAPAKKSEATATASAT